MLFRSFRRAIALKPDSPDWQHLLAALTGDSSPTTTPASYVRSLFDSYAGEFDAHLVDTLGYRVPELLLAAVLALAPQRKLDILDLGCGTGLCGVHFRPHAQRLTGVDLSQPMLAKAAARGIYDSLVSADAAEFLHADNVPFDLVLAADVFV